MCAPFFSFLYRQKLAHPSGKLLWYYCICLGFPIFSSLSHQCHDIAKLQVSGMLLSFSLFVIRNYLTLVVSCFASVPYVLGLIPNFLISLSLVMSQQNFMLVSCFLHILKYTFYEFFNVLLQFIMTYFDPISIVHTLFLVKFQSEIK